jgi:hypothetical protein
MILEFALSNKDGLFQFRNFICERHPLPAIVIADSALKKTKCQHCAGIFISACKSALTDSLAFNQMLAATARRWSTCLLLMRPVDGTEEAIASAPAAMLSQSRSDRPGREAPCLAKKEGMAAPE